MGTPSYGPHGISSGYQVVFEDHFDGTTLDTTKWNVGWFANGATVSGPVNANETACYRSDQVVVSGGALRLAVTDAPSTCSGAGGVSRKLPHTGALVNSNGKYQFTRGVLEAKVYIPSAAGSTACANWPAVWSNGQNWPEDGELDLFECLGGEAKWHVHTEDGLDHGGSGGRLTGWHVVSYEWTSTQVVFRYDGVVVGTQAYAKAAPHYIIMDNTTGSVGGPDTLPASFAIDYVKVWQRV